MKKVVILCRIFLLMLVTGCFAGYVSLVKKSIPGELYIDEFSLDTITVGTPFIGTIECDGIGAKVNLKLPVAINSGNSNHYEMKCKLFGLFDIKTVNVTVEKRSKIYPCGNPVGIYVETDGVYVVGTGDVDEKESPSKNIIQKGDYIEEINGSEVETISQVVRLVDASEGKEIILKIRRDESEFEVKINPVKASDGHYKMGVWVRDDCQGLGTMTYIATDGSFGTLGHAINEAGTGKLMEINNGKLYKAHIWSVVKGEKGKPGEIVGSIDYNENSYIGKISCNTNIGVYGTVDINYARQQCGQPCEIGYKQEICQGKASIRSFVGGQIKDYEIEITGLSIADGKENKGIEFQVTDEELINISGGIVQGMSGSPIIQNGRVIGAVTHVLINAPTKGYGIFIENMLKH